MNSVPTVGFGTGYPLLLVPCGTGSSQKHAIKSMLTVGNLVPASPSIHHVALALATIHHLICALSWGFVTNSPSVIGTTQYRLITKTKTRHQVPANSGDFGTGPFLCSPCGTGSVHHVVLASQQNTLSNLCPRQEFCHKLSLCHWYPVIPAPQQYTPIKSVLPVGALTPAPPL